MRACYKMYSIVQRVYPLTVDSLLSPGTLSIAFVILINYFTPKISNEIPTYIRRSRKVIHNFLKNVDLLKHVYVFVFVRNFRRVIINKYNKSY